jgi:hypothetical protein
MQAKDARGKAPRNVLVVSTVEHPEDRLRALLGDGVGAIEVIVPVVGQGLLDWLANDERARAHAEHVAQRTADALPGTTVRAAAGESDVALAVQDALVTFPADEVIVVTHPGEEAGWLEDPDDTRLRDIGVPVRRLTVTEG